MTYSRIAEVYETGKDFNGALDAYESSFAAAQKVSDAYPQNVAAKLILGIGYGKVGFTQAVLGQSREAMENSLRGLGILRAIAADDPQNTFAERQLACAFKNVGYAFLQDGNSKDAPTNFQTALAIKEKLCQKDASDAYLVGNIGEIFAYQGLAYEKTATNRISAEVQREAWNNARKRHRRSLETWLNLQKKRQTAAILRRQTRRIKTSSRALRFCAQRLNRFRAVEDRALDSKP